MQFSRQEVQSPVSGITWVVDQANPEISYKIYYDLLRQIPPAFRSIFLWTVCTHTAPSEKSSRALAESILVASRDDFV